MKQTITKNKNFKYSWFMYLLRQMEKECNDLNLAIVETTEDAKKLAEVAGDTITSLTKINTELEEIFYDTKKSTL